MLLAALPFLADVLPDPSSAASIGWLILTISAIAVAVNQVLGAMTHFRKLRELEPTAEGERIKALEADMRELEMRVERRIGEALGSINTRMGSLESTISRLVGDFSRALGVLEGRSDKNK